MSIYSAFHIRDARSLRLNTYPRIKSCAKRPTNLGKRTSTLEILLYVALLVFSSKGGLPTKNSNVNTPIAHKSTPFPY